MCARMQGRSASDKQTLVPVTIKQFQQAMAGDDDQTSRIDGRDVSQVFTPLKRFSLETSPLKRSKRGWGGEEAPSVPGYHRWPHPEDSPSINVRELYAG